MRIPRWFLALPLALATAVGTAQASSVRDQAGLFSPDAVRQAETELNRIERDNQITTTIETIDSLDGQTVGEAAQRLARQTGSAGLFVLIAKKESKIDAIAERSYSRAMSNARLRAIQNAFITEFKNRDFDAGLLKGVKTIRSEVSAAKSEFGTLRQGNAPLQRGVGPVRHGNRPGTFGLGSLLGIGLLILGVLFIARLIGSLFGGQRYPMGGPMGRPGYGPGYGGGGGFMSSLFGGIGGALAGNWLYDQFSGRHHHGGDYANTADYGNDAGNAPDWSGGSDAGGGDWGGGDGGGDWGGGGGGDWGGGGDGGGW